MLQIHTASRPPFAAALVSAALLAACGDTAKLPVEASIGPNPQLPAPAPEGPIPTVKTAPAKPWPQGAQPAPAARLRVQSFADNLESPFGMALVGNELFIANTGAIVKVPYNPGDTRTSGPVTKVADLPGGPLNHHWTKSLIASADGSKLYVGVGSNSNVAEHGMDHEKGRASVWEFDRATGQGREFATGLRNPVGLG